MDILTLAGAYPPPIILANIIEPIHLPLDLPITPVEAHSGLHRRLVQPDASGERLHFLDAARLGTPEPGVQSAHVVIAQHRPELFHEGLGEGDLRAGVVEPRQVGIFIGREDVMGRSKSQQTWRGV